MRVAALLTGRGNNTLKDKNILPVLGEPLMSYPARAAKAVQLIDYFYVSSDDEKILDIGCDLGYARIKRPSELSLPDSQHIEAIGHALDCMKEDDVLPDILVVLLANSATVKSDWIAKAVNIIISDNEVSSVVPVYQEQDHHPYRAKKLQANGSLETFFNFHGRDISTNRQDLEPCYFLCHNFWVLNLEKSLYSDKGQQPWTFLGDNIKPIFVEGCFDVHTPNDLAASEEWIRVNGIK